MGKGGPRQNGQDEIGSSIGLDWDKIEANGKSQERPVANKEMKKADDK